MGFSNYLRSIMLFESINGKVWWFCQAACIQGFFIPQPDLLAQKTKKIQQRVEISQLIYYAEIKFERLVSHNYNLYENDNGEYLLSMIGPKDWGFKGNPYTFISSVKLLGDHTWEIM